MSDLFAYAYGAGDIDVLPEVFLNQNFHWYYFKPRIIHLVDLDTQVTSITWEVLASRRSHQGTLPRNALRSTSQFIYIL